MTAKYYEDSPTINLATTTSQHHRIHTKRMKFFATIAILSFYAPARTAGQSQSEGCFEALSLYPQNATDSEGSTYNMELASATCQCINGIAVCDYMAEGNSVESGNTKYEFVKCDALACGDSKECTKPDDWKDAGFDVKLFDAAVFEPWCVEKAAAPSGSFITAYSSSIQLIAGAAVVVAML